MSGSDDRIDEVLRWAQSQGVALRNRGYDDPMPDFNAARAWYQHVLSSWKTEELSWHEWEDQALVLLMKAGLYLKAVSNEEAQEIATKIGEFLGGGSGRHAEAHGAEARDPSG